MWLSSLSSKLNCGPGSLQLRICCKQACHGVNAVVVFLCFYFVVRLLHRSRTACCVPCKRSFNAWGIFPQLLADRAICVLGRNMNVLAVYLSENNHYKLLNRYWCNFLKCKSTSGFLFIRREVYWKLFLEEICQPCRFRCSVVIDNSTAAPARLKSHFIQFSWFIR